MSKQLFDGIAVSLIKINVDQNAFCKLPPLFGRGTLLVNSHILTNGGSVFQP
jgi:hypothetical protein